MSAERTYEKNRETGSRTSESSLVSRGPGMVQQYAQALYQAQAPCSKPGCPGNAAFLVQPIPYCAHHLPGVRQRKTANPLQDVDNVKSVAPSLTAPASVPSQSPPDPSFLRTYQTIYEPTQGAVGGRNTPRAETTLPGDLRNLTPGCSMVEKQCGDIVQKQCHHRGCTFFGDPEFGGYCSEHFRQYSIADARGLLPRPAQRQINDQGYKATPNLYYSSVPRENSRLPSENIYETIDVHGRSINPTYGNTCCANHSDNYVDCFARPSQEPQSLDLYGEGQRHAASQLNGRMDVTLGSSFGYERVTHNHACCHGNGLQRTDIKQPKNSDFSSQQDNLVRQLAAGSRKCVNRVCSNYGSAKNNGYCNACMGTR